MNTSLVDKIQSLTLEDTQEYNHAMMVISRLMLRYIYIKRAVHMGLISSSLQTKQWRQSQDWYKTGKSNECELYQRDSLCKITGHRIIKTCMRINIEKNVIVSCARPLANDDGYEYTEDFDGTLVAKQKIYFNLKFVCSAGGAQTRTLREVYHFIKAQLNLLLDKKSDMVFINILDGDTSYAVRNKFEYLLRKDIYHNIRDYVFVGDMYEFHLYWNQYMKHRT